jgi:hypothetical protein
MKILHKEITRTQTSFSTNFSGKLSFILCFLFPERLHYCYIYFHCSYLYNYYNYSRTLCNMCWRFNTQISYSDLIKFPYFADTTKRGDKGWKKQRVTLWILYCFAKITSNLCQTGQVLCIQKTGPGAMYPPWFRCPCVRSSTTWKPKAETTLKKSKSPK